MDTRRWYLGVVLCNEFKRTSTNAPSTNHAARFRGETCESLTKSLSRDMQQQVSLLWTDGCHPSTSASASRSNRSEAVIELLSQYKLHDVHFTPSGFQPVYSLPVSQPTTPHRAERNRTNPNETKSRFLRFSRRLWVILVWISIMGPWSKFGSKPTGSPDVFSGKMSTIMLTSYRACLPPNPRYHCHAQHFTTEHFVLFSFEMDRRNLSVSADVGATRQPGNKTRQQPTTTRIMWGPSPTNSPTTNNNSKAILFRCSLTCG